jgi:hypothetical protein
VSGSDEDPGIYTMPAGAFRIGSEAPPPTPPERPGSPQEPASPRPVRRRRGWDIALTIVLLVLLLAAAVVASAYGFAIGLAAGACGGGGRLCQAGLRDLGVWMALTTPWLVAAVATFVGVLLLVIRRRGFWVPLAGVVLMGALWLIGAVLVWAAI